MESEKSIKVDDTLSLKPEQIGDIVNGTNVCNNSTIIEDEVVENVNKKYIKTAQKIESGNIAKDEKESAQEINGKVEQHQHNGESVSKDVSDTGTGDAKNVENCSWMYVLGHDKLKMKVIRCGGGEDTRPVYGQIVTVRCCGELEDGTKIDQSEQLTFTLGDGDVIQALDLCVALMQLNALCQIITHGQYAYGAQGRKPDVPADASVTYEIELLKVENAPDIHSRPIAEKVLLGNEKRGRGNFWYNRGEYAAAINSYTKALVQLDESNIASETTESIQEFTDIRVKCFNNLAAAQLKVEAWDAAIKSCDSAIKLQPNNCKAHFRKGKCLAAKGELESAISSLREAIKLEPESKVIHQELSKLANKHKIQTQSTKEMYQRMLGTDTTAIKTQKSKLNWLTYAGYTTAAIVAVGAIVIVMRPN